MTYRSLSSDDHDFGQVGDGTTTQRLTPVSVLSGGIASYTYGSASHKHAVTALSSGESYTYDANGNMTQRVEGGLTYTQTFDAENRLVSVAVSGQTTQFIYDGDGNLVKKVKADGSWTIYVGKVYEVDKSSGGAVTRTLSYYGVAGAMRISGTLYFVLTDQLGSASVVTDNTGAIVGDQRYYPYGETRVPSGNMYTDRLYTGQRQMATLGIYDYNARFYSPLLGRFLSADPIVPQLGNPQIWNHYAYVSNNPLRYIDPTGYVMCGVGREDDGPQCVAKAPDYYDPLKHPENFSSPTTALANSTGNRAARTSGQGGVTNASNPPSVPTLGLKILPVGAKCPAQYTLVQCAYGGL